MWGAASVSYIDLQEDYAQFEELEKNVKYGFSGRFLVELLINGSRRPEWRLSHW